MKRFKGTEDEETAASVIIRRSVMKHFKHKANAKIRGSLRGHIQKALTTENEFSTEEERENENLHRVEKLEAELDVQSRRLLVARKSMVAHALGRSDESLIMRSKSNTKKLDWTLGKAEGLLLFFQESFTSRVHDLKQIRDTVHNLKDGVSMPEDLAPPGF